MNNLKKIYIGFVFLAIAACSERSSDEHGMNGNIQLGATVGDLEIGSRVVADPYLPQKGELLEAAVWLRKESDISGYADNPDAATGMPVHTTVTFSGSGLEDVSHNGKNLQYPVSDEPVYCVGMYPALRWEAIDNNKIASHHISGVEDLMFAKEMKGRWNEHFSFQHYEHLLTWIKINICATSYEAIDAWGKIEEITIISDSEVKVNLTNGTYQYETPKPIVAMNGNIPLSTSTHEVGSVFCSPEKEYQLTVKTGVAEEPRTISLPLNIIDVENGDKISEVTEESEARGKCFVFSLYFTPHDVIEGVCTLNSWSNQNEDIYLD